MSLLPIVLKLVDTPLYRFSGHSVRPYRGVEFIVTAGNLPAQATVLSNFLVVDNSRVCNAIIGRLTLNALRVITSTYNLVLKFPTLVGIGVVREN